MQGNAFALEAVLHQVLAEQPDHIVCLGDVATGPAPVAALEMLHRHNCLCVRGNMDDVVLNVPVSNPPEDDTAKRYTEIDRWCNDQLSQSDADTIASWPLNIFLDLSDNVRCLFCHGSPRSNEDVIEAVTPDVRLSELLAGFEAQLVFTGHMHNPMLRPFHETLIVNPGSVGLPFGGKRLMPTRAEFAMIDCDRQDINLSFRSVTYDDDAFSAWLLASGMPHAGWYLSKWQT